MQEQLSNMAAVAARLEADGAEIIAAGFDKIAGPRLHLWGPSLPKTVRARGTFLSRCEDRAKVGYIEGGTKVFWMED